MHPEDHLIWRDPAQPDYHVGREEGDLLIGNPVVNDKGPMAAWLLAAKAIRDAGVTLVGPMYLTAVPGEIGQEPVDEFQGKRYLSKEVGARYLVNHTPRASFCLCAEATGFRKGWIEAGKAFYKITVYGGPVLYTPYVARPYPPGEHPNAIVRALPLIARLEEWALEYEQRHTYASPGGTVVPRVNVSAIRAGQPWLVLQNPEVCMLYLDIRTVPGQDGGAIRHELRALQKRVGITAVYVTHDREEALTLADRIAVLDAGRVVQYGPPEEIFHRPTSAFVAGFMGADNAIELRRDDRGRLRSAAGNPDAGEAVMAHFRSDVARIDATAGAADDADLRLHGQIVQALYVGQGYRYRVRTAGADVWAHANDRIDEGAPVAVVVPREALLLFPRVTTQADRDARPST